MDSILVKEEAAEIKATRALKEVLKKQGYPKTNCSYLQNLYGTTDSYCFSDVLNWCLSEIGIESEIMGVYFNGSALSLPDHVWCEVTTARETFYVDVYGFFESAEEIINRYNKQVIATKPINHNDQQFKNWVKLSQLWAINGGSHDTSEDDFFESQLLMLLDFFSKLK